MTMVPMHETKFWYFSLSHANCPVYYFCFEKQWKKKKTLSELFLLKMGNCAVRECTKI